MKRMCVLAFLICFLAVYLPVAAKTADGPGDNGYGSLDLSDLSEAAKQYLGLDGDAKPILQNVSADLMVVEYMNTACPNCLVQAVVFNKLYSSIEKDQTTKSRVKMLSIAVGNNTEEIEAFEKEMQTVFPILIDPDLEIRERLAKQTRTPYTVMLRRDEEGNFIQVDSHRGAVKSHRSYLDEIKVVMQYDENMIKMKQAENLAGKVVEKTRLKLSEEEIVAKVRKIMIQVSGDENIDVAEKDVIPQVKPTTYEKTYLGKSGEAKYSAVVVNEEAVCDVCHAIQFIYIFNERGEVVSFEPIYISKSGNEAWDDEDIEKMRKSVLELSIFQLMSFDPEVDAVTSATISSAIIFKAIAQGKLIYRFMR